MIVKYFWPLLYKDLVVNASFLIGVNDFFVGR